MMLFRWSLASLPFSLCPWCPGARSAQGQECWSLTCCSFPRALSSWRDCGCTWALGTHSPGGCCVLSPESPPGSQRAAEPGMWGGTDALSALLRDTLGTGGLLLFLALELLITSLHHGAFLLLFFLLSSPFVCRLPPVPLHSQLLLCLFLLNVFFHLSFFLSK